MNAFPLAVDIKEYSPPAPPGDTDMSRGSNPLPFPPSSLSKALPLPSPFSADIVSVPSSKLNGGRSSGMLLLCGWPLGPADILKS